MIIEYLLLALGIYLLCGTLFAAPFVVVGAGRIDPHAGPGTWGFRLLIIPGAIFLWPLLLGRWRRGLHESPEEKNAHRCAAHGCHQKPH